MSASKEPRFVPLAEVPIRDRDAWRACDAKAYDLLEQALHRSGHQIDLRRNRAVEACDEFGALSWPIRLHHLNYTDPKAKVLAADSIVRWGLRVLLSQHLETERDGRLLITTWSSSVIHGAAQYFDDLQKGEPADEAWERFKVYARETFGVRRILLQYDRDLRRGRFWDADHVARRLRRFSRYELYGRHNMGVGVLFTTVHCGHRITAGDRALVFKVQRILKGSRSFAEFLARIEAIGGKVERAPAVTSAA
jgi:hypothetical protein